jgi:hypothetical protein
MRRVRIQMLALTLLTLAACGGSDAPAGGDSASADQAPRSTSPGGAGSVGNYQKVDVASSDVKAAAEFAVSEQAKRTGSTLTLGAIKSAQRQTVAGANFLLCLDYDQEGSGEHATVVVFRGPDRQHTLTSWTVAPCE